MITFTLCTLYLVSFRVRMKTITWTHVNIAIIQKIQIGIHSAMVKSRQLGSTKIRYFNG